MCQINTRSQVCSFVRSFDECVYRLNFSSFARISSDRCLCVWDCMRLYSLFHLLVYLVLFFETNVCLHISVATFTAIHDTIKPEYHEKNKRKRFCAAYSQRYRRFIDKYRSMSERETKSKIETILSFGYAYHIRCFFNHDWGARTLTQRVKR